MSIVVIGSSNTDLVMNVKQIPTEGETVLGNKFSVYLGGKGSNQAVSACRMGGKVYFISCIGNDYFGNKAIEKHIEEGLNTKYIFRKNINSGIALINVGENGKNSISVSSGSNNFLSKEHIDVADLILKKAKIVLLQLEIPLEIVEYVINKCKTYNCKIILNPAPAMRLDKNIYNNIDIITPNQREAEILSEIKILTMSDIKEAASNIFKKGVKKVIITLGEQGVYFYSKKYKGLISGFKVNSIDTTGAGDTFNGCLAYFLSKTDNTYEAIKFSSAAAALSVMKNGAQESIPKYQEVSDFIKYYK